MQRDRFLTGILIGIGALVALALLLFFVRDRNVDYVADSTPEGVVQNYFLALQRKEYERAYGYLATGENKVTEAQFFQHFSTYGGDEVSRTTAEIGKTFDLPDGNAAVQVDLMRGGGGIFDTPYRQSESVNLRQENGAWKIISAPYPFWDYSWYTPMPPGK